MDLAGAAWTCASSSPARVRAGEAEAVGLAVDGGGRELGVDREDQHAERRRSGRRSTCSPAPVISTRPGREQAGDVGAEPRAELGAARAGPAAWAASRSAAAASEEPPPIPAATGIRLSIVSRCGGAVPAGRARGRAASARPARLGPSTPGQMTSSASPGAGSSVSSSASESAWTTETSGCSPSSRGVPTKRQRLTLPGARANSLIAGSPRTARAIPPAPRLSARASAGRPSASSAARGRGRGPSPPARASPAAPSSGARSRRCTSARSSGSGGGADPPQADQHGVDVRDRVEDAPRHRAQHAHLARQLGEHGRRAVGRAAGLRREPLADLALDHRDLGRRRRGAPRPRAGSPSPRRRRGGWRRPWSGPAARRARSSRTASPKCSVALANGSRASRRAGSSLRSTSTTWTWATRDARYSLSTPSPPPTSSTTSSSASAASRPITSSRFESIRKFCPRSRLGRMPNAFEAAQARLRREPAHQPNRRAAFASTACSSSS